MFWLTVPETYACAAATMLIALGTAAWAERQAMDERWFVAASALTLSITVTNWMAGIASAWAGRPWRRAVQVTMNGFALVVLGWAVQRAVVPHADFFIGYSNEDRYLFRPEAGGATRILPALFISAVVMPPVGVVEKAGRGPTLSIQRSGWAHRGAWSVAAVLLWVTLLALGAWGWTRRMRQSRAAVAVGIVLAGQLALHLLYGTETFLYALNFASLLVVVAAFATTRAPRLAYVLGAALVACNLVNNGQQWLSARAFFRTAPTVDANARPPAPLR